MTPQWLDWARRLQAIAQTGRYYGRDVYDQQRYEEINEIAAEMFAQAADTPIENIRDLLQHDDGYCTPKVDVRAFVLKDGQLLMVKESEDGLWTLPGGWADVGDSPSLAVEREVREEAGLEVKATKLLAVFDRNRHPHPPYPFHAWKMFFRCEILGGELRGSEETTDVGFFPEHALPPLSIMRVTESQIRHFFEHARQPDRPTTFD